MQSSPTLAALAPALAKAQAEARAAFKSGENKFDKYKYAKYEDIAQACKPVMSAHGLSVLFTADELIALPDRVVGANKDKLETAVRVKVSARLLHESGEWMESAAWGEGQDRADKAPYKAMTGAKKYLLAGLFAIPTTDDPESDETVGGADLRNDRGQGSKPSTPAQTNVAQRTVVHAAGNGAAAPRQQTTGAATAATSTSAKVSPTASPTSVSPSGAATTDAKSRATAAFVELKKWDELLASGLWFGLCEKKDDGTLDVAATCELRGKELPRALLGIEDAVTKVGESCARDAIEWAMETYGWPMRSPQLKRGGNGSYSVENPWPNREQALLAVRSLMGEQVPTLTKGATP